MCKIFHSVVELSEEEKQQIMITEDYKKFLDRTSRLMERALTQDVDIFVDYTGDLSDDGLVIISPFFLKKVSSVSTNPP